MAKHTSARMMPRSPSIPSSPHPSSYPEYPADSYTQPIPPRSHSHARSESYATSRSESSYAKSTTCDPEKNAPQRLSHKSLQQHDYQHELRRKRWTRKHEIILFGTLFFLTIIGIGVIAAVHNRFSSSFDYTPSNVHVTSEKAFASGGATHNSPFNTNDGVGRGQDRYVYYSGGPENFPPSSEWVSFEDMWSLNLPNIQQSCTWLDSGSDNTDEQNQDIYDAIQNRAEASLVDHRFILAVVLQESHGCVHVDQTVSSGGVRNPGLMQSHNGASFSSSHQNISILAMIQDGVQGTATEGSSASAGTENGGTGVGLVQLLNIYGNPYSAARGYNSGHIPPSGNLSEAAGATACYVSDIANRLTGCVNAKSTCPDDNAL